MHIFEEEEEEEEDTLWLGRERPEEKDSTERKGDGEAGCVCVCVCARAGGMLQRSHDAQHCVQLGQDRASIRSTSPHRTAALAHFLRLQDAQQDNQRRQQEHQ